VDKAPDAFRTISEVADDLRVPQHVLRFWESRFPQIRPMKRAGGRRYYRPDDVDLLRGIHHLLYGEGYTIRGVQRILREHGPKFVQAVWRAGAPQPLHEPADLDEPVEGPEEQGEEERGIPGLLSPREREASVEPAMRDAPDAPQPASPARMAADDLRRLQTALQELAECRRLLDAALNE
jgi:DNA-binding transcriptional MerR regulator